MNSLCFQNYIKQDIVSIIAAVIVFRITTVACLLKITLKLQQKRMKTERLGCEHCWKNSLSNPFWIPFLRLNC